MRISKWFFFLLVVGCLLVQSPRSSAQQSRPDDEITRLAADVYLFRHHSHQSIFITTPKGVIVTDPDEVSDAGDLVRGQDRSPHRSSLVRYVDCFTGP